MFHPKKGTVLKLLRYVRRHSLLQITDILVEDRLLDATYVESQLLVQDDEMEVHDMGFIGSYLGSMGSKIRYCLESDEGSEQALNRFEDFAAPKMVGDGKIVRKVDASGKPWIIPAFIRENISCPIG